MKIRAIGEVKEFFPGEDDNYIHLTYNVSCDPFASDVYLQIGCESSPKVILDKEEVISVSNTLKGILTDRVGNNFLADGGRIEFSYDNRGEPYRSGVVVDIFMDLDFSMHSGIFIEDCEVKGLIKSLDRIISVS